MIFSFIQRVHYIFQIISLQLLITFILTLLSGSSLRWASSTASEIWSHILSAKKEYGFIFVRIIFLNIIYNHSYFDIRYHSASVLIVSWALLLWSTTYQGKHACLKNRTSRHETCSCMTRDAVLSNLMLHNTWLAIPYT